MEIKEPKGEIKSPGPGYLFNYPEDRFFTTILPRLLIIPEGYKGVRQRMGISNENSSLYPFRGPEVNPGFRFFLGLGGLWGRMAVVDTRLRTEDLHPQKLITRDNVELTAIDASLNYQVTNPINAMTRAEDYKFTTHQIAEARVRNTIGGLTLEELSKLSKEERNLALDENGDKYKFPELDEIGVDMKGLYITQIDLPDEIKKALAQQATARAEALGELILAEHRIEVGRRHKIAAQFYKDDEEAQAMRDRAIADEVAKNATNITLFPIGGIIDAVSGLIRRKKEDA
jgi:regulator of protease activity HflC (stomatin/prohibitin superfamily)